VARPQLSWLLVLAACASPSKLSSTAPDAPESVSGTEANTPAVSEQAPAAGADPSVNEFWSGDDIDPLVERLEGESREIYVHRELLTSVVAPPKGGVVADIGAGSGFMSLLFAKEVGPEGRVISVDINAKMLERVAALAKEAGHDNLETMVSEQAQTPLAPDSVDLVFICDTYHHFESPATTMASVHAALREGGEVVLVDFERIEGKTPEGLMKHVRAGKEVFRQEVLDAGFELVTEHEVPELEDNYVLRFRKAP
jgi:predicted methyltransferase